MNTILLVEDDRNQRLLYEEQLENNGYDVVSVADGREALLAIVTANPDLVVLDINMPGMDGIEALARMLSIRPTTPVVINTGYSSYRDNFRTWAADAYVVKSSDTSELLETIDRILESSGAKR